MKLIDRFQNFRFWVFLPGFFYKKGDGMLRNIIILVTSVFISILLTTNVIAKDKVEDAIGKLNSSSKTVVMESIRVLIQINTPRSTEGLISALNNSNDTVRYLVTYELGKRALSGSTKARATEGLIAALGNKDKDVRLTATKNLFNLKSPRGVEGLIRALDLSDLDIRRIAVRGLKEKLKVPSLSERAIEGLIHALDNPSVDIRTTAVNALARCSSPRAKEGLKKAVNDDDPQVSRIAKDNLKH